MELIEKIQLLRASGVKKFKDKDIEIEFEVVELAPPKPPEPVFPPGTPPEIANPDLMSQDQILNWSGSPDIGQDQPEETLQGTGDQPV